MPDPYPFRGAVRWTVMPALVVGAGALVSVVEDAFQPGFRLGPWISAVAGAAFAFPIGAALAAARRPALAAFLAFVLGGMSLYVVSAVLTYLLKLRVTFDTRLVNVGSMGGAAAVVVLAHLLYRSARGLGKAGVAGGALVYVLASTAAARLAALSADVPMVDIFRRGLVGGILQWLAMEVALRVSERAAPAPTAPAPNA